MHSQVTPGETQEVCIGQKQCLPPINHASVRDPQGLQSPSCPHYIGGCGIVAIQVRGNYGWEICKYTGYVTQLRGTEDSWKWGMFKITLFLTLTLNLKALHLHPCGGKFDWLSNISE